MNRPKQNTELLRKIFGAITGIVFVLITIIQAGGQTWDSKEPISADNEIVIVTQAIASALAGNANPSPVIQVKFAAGGIPPPNPTVRNGDFQLSSTATFPYTRGGISNMQRQLAGVLRYHDPLGRFLSLFFEADYRRSPEGTIVIDAAAVRQVVAAAPVILIQFIPRDKVPGSLLASQSFQKLFEHVRKNTASHSYNQKNILSRKDYYVFAFFMDRLESDAKCNLVISDHPEGSKGAIKSTVTFQDDGWHVAYAPATFAENADPPVFFKALYTPGGSIPEHQRKTVIAGVFTSDSLTKQTQRLLAARGYDPGPADGLMGKRTVKAIQDFQRDHRMIIDGKLSFFLLSSLAGAGLSVPSPKEGGAQSAQSGLPDWVKPKMWPNRIERSE